MKMQFLALALVAAAATAGVASAQTYGSGGSNWQRTVTPQTPKPPAAPYTPQAPAFKPYQGTSTYSPRSGLDPYPAPARPKAPPTSLFGPENKPRH